MICDGRTVCIIQNVPREVVKILNFSRYMLLDLNIQSLGSSAYVMQFVTAIKQVTNSFYEGLKECPFVRMLGYVYLKI